MFFVSLATAAWYLLLTLTVFLLLTLGINVAYKATIPTFMLGVVSVCISALVYLAVHVEHLP